VPTFEVKLFVGDFVSNQKVAYFHRGGALALDCVVGDASNGVITMNGCWRLTVL
jgi:hypothetical protein